MEVYVKFFKYGKYKEGLEYLKGKKEEKFILASAYTTGGLGYARNKFLAEKLDAESPYTLMSESLDEMMEEALRDNVFAQFIVANNGNASWLLTAAGNGYASAQYQLAISCRELTVMNYWLKEAADQCHYNACVEFSNGCFNNKDLEMGAKYLIKGKCYDAILWRIRFRYRLEVYWYGKEWAKNPLFFKNVIHDNPQDIEYFNKTVYREVVERMKSALYTWLIVGKKLGLIRDVRNLIGKFIIELQDEWLI